MLLAVLDVETVKQLTVDGFFRGCSYGLLGAGFALILGVTGRFHFAYAFTYTFAVYMAYQFTFPWGVPFWPSAMLTALTSPAIATAMSAYDSHNARVQGLKCDQRMAVGNNCGHMTKAIALNKKRMRRRLDGEVDD